MRVSTTLCATSGTVSSVPSAAAAAAKAGTPGRERIGNAVPLEPAQLLGERAVDRQVPGVQPRDILTRRMGAHELRFDLVEIHRRGVDDARTGRRERDELRRHDRSGIEADRAARDEVAAAHGDEIGRARAGADEVHGHGRASFDKGAGRRADHDARHDEAGCRAAGRERRRLGDGRNAREREDALRPRRDPLARRRKVRREERPRAARRAPPPRRRCRARFPSPPTSRSCRSPRGRARPAPARPTPPSRSPPRACPCGIRCRR